MVPGPGSTSNQILGFSPPIQDHSRGSNFVCYWIIVARTSHCRNHIARANIIHSNAESAKINCHCACYLPQGGFRSLIGRIVWKAHVCAQAGYVDNRTSTSFGKFLLKGNHPTET